MGKRVVICGGAQHFARLANFTHTPCDRLVSPLDSVVEVLGNGVWLIHVGLTSVVSGSISLAEEVALHLVWLRS